MATATGSSVDNSTGPATKRQKFGNQKDWSADALEDIYTGELLRFRLLQEGLPRRWARRWLDGCILNLMDFMTWHRLQLGYIRFRRLAKWGGGVRWGWGKS